MIDPDYYLLADLSITKIESPVEFFDWESYKPDEDWDDCIEYWKYIMALHRQDEIDSAEADDLGDVLVELEFPDDLIGW